MLRTKGECKVRTISLRLTSRFAYRKRICQLISFQCEFVKSLKAVIGFYPTKSWWKCYRNSLRESVMSVCGRVADFVVVSALTAVRYCGILYIITRDSKSDVRKDTAFWCMYYQMSVVRMTIHVMHCVNVSSNGYALC